MDLRSFCEWLGNTPGSMAIHESLYAYPIIESIHVLTLCLFVGMIMMWDLRLMGLTLQSISVQEMSARLLPWAIAGFIIMTISGGLLVYQDPVRAYHSSFFRAKVIMLILAGLNALIFHLTNWGSNLEAPKRARMAGGISLTLWAGIIVAGRMIAYTTGKY